MLEVCIDVDLGCYLCFFEMAEVGNFLENIIDQMTIIFCNY